MTEASEDKQDSGAVDPDVTEPDAAEAGTPRRRRWRVLAGILVFTVIELGLVEAALHVWQPVFRPYGFRRMPNGLIMNIPQPHDNRWGFIDIDHTKEKPPGTYRINGIGGSLGATGGVNTNIFRVMSTRFRRQGFPEVEVINNCVPNYTIDLSYDMLTKWTLDFSPDTVVLLFDVIQYTADWEAMQNPIVADGHVFFGAKIPCKIWYYAKAIRMRTINTLLTERESVEMPWYRGGLGDLPTPEEKPPKIGPRDSEPGLFSVWEYLVFNYQLMYLFQKDPTEEYRDNFEFQAKYFLKMRDVCRENGMRFVVVVFPAEQQTNPYLGPATIEYFEMDAEKYDFNKPYNDTLEWLEAKGIEALPLLGYFQQVQKPLELFMPRNVHLSDFGQVVAGQGIADRILDLGWVQAGERAEDGKGGE
jgi:hypothetical protein